MNIGVAAHITAASERGPRYEPSLSSEERRDLENGIWLCQNCGKLIDSDISRYSIAKLGEWKSDAEAAAARALEQRRAPASTSVGVFLEAERLMPELLSEMRSDVRGDSSQLIREFVVLSNRQISYISPNRPFAYFASEHQELYHAIEWQLEMGMIRLVQPDRHYPLYRFLPHFAEYLRQGELP
ncbi:MAG: hypothetical protein MPN21_17820 [Thermoanaerobaculia bacterium]|nr:hypothetical protein [Thermoanaerobaculia bacterium]